MRIPFVAAALAVALTPSVAQAQDACPNAALRTGKQAALPDCRAWEQVTPADKNGVAAASFFGSYSSPSGDRLFSIATGAAVPTDSGFQFRGLSSARTGDWSTVPTDAPQPGAEDFNTYGTYLFSDDGTKVLTASPLALTPGAVAGNSNLYVRDLTRQDGYTLAASLPGTAFIRQLVQARIGVIDATPDLSTILIFGSREVDPTLPEDAPTYLWRVGGGRVRPASVLPDGEPGAALAPQTPPDGAHVLSDDGKTVVWQSADTQRYYRATLGSETVELTRPRTSSPEIGAAQSPAFSTPDGTESTFAASSKLTDDSTPGSNAIYRAQGDELIDLAARFSRGGSGVNYLVQGVSRDREIVWFTADSLTGADSPDDPGEPSLAKRLFALDARRGTIRRVAVFDRLLESSGPAAYRFSPDGQRVAFLSYSPLTGQDNANPACPNPNQSDLPACGQVFTWNARTPEAPLVCASCAGDKPTASASFTKGGLTYPLRPTRAITDDGRVFFDTAESLVRADTDAVSDVYQYTPGAGPQLLSAGGTGLPATFADASEDGTNVFFHTVQRLVEQDTDDLPDAYVARTGGGIAAQRVTPAPPAEPCQESGCRPAAQPQPARPEPGSRTLAPPTKTVVPRFSVRRPTARALRAAARTGRLTVAVQVTAPGTVTANLRGRVRGATRTVASGSRKATRAQTVRVALRLSQRARAAVRRGRRLRLTLTVGYSERLDRSRTTVTIQKGGAR